MGIFARAVVTGFGFSLGSALFKRISKQLGFEDESTDVTDKPDADAADGDLENDADVTP